MVDTVLYPVLMTFIAVTLLFGIILSRIIEKKHYVKRLKKYNLVEEKQEKKQTMIEHHNLLKKVGLKLEQIINLSKHELLILQSGIKLSLGEVFIGRLLVLIIFVMIGNLYHFHFLFIILLGAIGYYLPIIYIKNKRIKRLERSSAQLGEALGTMANALRAGFSFMQALKMVAKEIEEPLGPEFLKALQEINYGISVEDAFENMLKRLPDKELELVLNTMIIQRTSGGNLALLLETMQETIINRHRVKDEVKTLTAQGKMSSIIITLLPIALAIYIRLVNPEYYQMLFSHPVGWMMVIVGSVNIILGWLFIKKIIHIEV